MELTNPLGYLPILIALVGLLVLTGLIVTSSLKEKLRQARFFKSKLQKIAEQREELARQALEHFGGEVRGITVETFRGSKTPQPEAVRSVVEAMEEAGLENAKFLITRLKEADRHVEDYGKSYRQVVRHYNHLLVQMPTRMFAKVFRFRPLSLET